MAMIDQLSRRSLLATGALAACGAISGLAHAQSSEKIADFLFVQSAARLEYQGRTNRITLIGINPSTLFFSDRPDRIAGQMKTSRFVPFWSEGTNSFKSDPPNADISIVEGGKLQQVIVVLSDPVLTNNDLSYTVKVLQGELPERGNDVSVFIDAIGMPLTPVSYAGVARRSFRRAVIY
jgi:hypothetical protein